MRPHLFQPFACPSRAASFSGGRQGLEPLVKLITPELRRPSAAPEPVPTAEAEPGVVRTVIEIPATDGPPSHRAPPLTVEVERCGRTLVVAVDGEVDLHTAPAVREAIESALADRPKRLVVDLTLVRFLNSAGLEVLLAAHRLAGSHTDLRVVATTRATWRPLQIARLHEQLVIHTSRSAAIAAPAKRAEDRGSPLESTES
jgi:anti-sigma B factor antagonist